MAVIAWYTGTAMDVGFVVITLKFGLLLVKLLYRPGLYKAVRRTTTSHAHSNDFWVWTVDGFQTWSLCSTFYVILYSFRFWGFYILPHCLFSILCCLSA